ncbi:MAG: aldo/keto reductase, partial [Candidatus Marinimicrobia bacterium]|nr:aldo/keto reductase [Candidatus Neomarinimicrobiota bacterium]
FIQDCRDEVIISSKVYFPTGDSINERGSTRYHIIRAVEESLRRLNTDFIDVYFLHRFEDLTPLDETLRVLDDLVRQGKILYLAVSNFAAWQIEKALGISALKNLAPITAVQPMYNLVKRQAEVEILPVSQAENLAVVPYSPLGGGLLTGKYGPDKKPEIGRLLDNKMYEVRYGKDWVYNVATEFAEFARNNGYEPAALAIAWVASHPSVTAPLLGARNMEQLETNLKATEIDMTAELRDEISSLAPTPPPATDRDEERTEHNYGVR